MSKYGPERAFPSNAIDPEFGGMELRDWFAGQALVYIGRRKDIRLSGAADIATVSYEIADAMMAQKEKRHAPNPTA